MEILSSDSKTSFGASLPTERSPKCSAKVKDEILIVSPSTDLNRVHSKNFKYHLLTGTKCPVCNREFQDNATLIRHYGIHDGYYTTVCLICGIGFSKNAQLRLHKSKVHRTPKSSDLVCFRCGGAFDKNYQLNKHMMLCISTKRDPVMQCFLCVRTFDTWHQQKSHAWTHFNKCSFCEEKITVQSRRLEHMFTCLKNPLNQGKFSFNLYALIVLKFLKMFNKKEQPFNGIIC